MPTANKSVRVIAFAAANVQHLKTVNIITSLALDVHHSIPTFLQLTAAQAVAQAKTQPVPTYMDGSAHPAGLPTIFISGYNAPS
jgi:hypothetical protein